MIWIACIILCLYGIFGNERGRLARCSPSVLTSCAVWIAWLTWDWQFIEASCLTFSTLLFYIGATRYDPHH